MQKALLKTVCLPHCVNGKTNTNEPIQTLERCCAVMDHGLCIDPAHHGQRPTRHWHCDDSTAQTGTRDTDP